MATLFHSAQQANLTGWWVKILQVLEIHVYMEQLVENFI